MNEGGWVTLCLCPYLFVARHLSFYTPLYVAMYDGLGWYDLAGVTVTKLVILSTSDQASFDC